MIKEVAVKPWSGWGPLFVFFALILSGPAEIIIGAGSNLALIPVGILSLVAALLILFGFQAVAPNEARVLLLFGAYHGSITESGFFWVNPFYTKRKISLRVRNFETAVPSQHRKEKMRPAQLCNTRVARRVGPQRSTIETAIRLRFLR